MVTLHGMKFNPTNNSLTFTSADGSYTCNSTCTYYLYPVGTYSLPLNSIDGRTLTFFVYAPAIPGKVTVFISNSNGISNNVSFTIGGITPPPTCPSITGLINGSTSITFEHYKIYSYEFGGGSAFQGRPANVGITVQDQSTNVDVVGMEILYEGGGEEFRLLGFGVTVHNVTLTWDEGSHIFRLISANVTVYPLNCLK
jgi:hypothetical protein